MRNGLLLFVISIAFSALSQGGFEKGSRGNDYIVVVNDGIQFSLAATYLIPGKETNGQNQLLSGNRESYLVKPEGKIRYAAELGFAHFPKWKGIPIKFLKKSSDLALLIS